MKKITSKLLSVLLIMTLLFTSAGTVFADETELANDAAKAESTVSENEVQSFGANKTVKVQSTAAPAYDTMASINAKTILYSTTEKSSKTYSNILPGSMKLIPVVAKNTGIMHLDVNFTNVNNNEWVYIYLCDTLQDAVSEDGECWEEFMLYGSSYGNNASDSSTYGMPVKKGKTYYIAIESDYDNKAAASIKIAPYVYTVGERTLPYGTSKWTVASGLNTESKTSSTYFKIKPTKTGLMSVKLTEFDKKYSSTGDIKLYNSKKKAVSEELYYSSSSNTYSTVYFGVKKGVTYYLKVTDCDGNMAQNKFGIKYSVTAKTDRALSSKSKAKTLKRKASATESLFVASTAKSADWYKFNVTSKRKTAIEIDTRKVRTGNVYVSLYKGSKKIGSTQTIYPNQQVRISCTYGTTYGKANSGKYYVKVQQGTKTNGAYKIKYAY